MATATYFKNTPNSSAATSFTWAVACAVGSTIYLAAQHQGGGAITVADTNGNTWTKVAATLDYSTPATSQRILDVYACTPTAAVSSVTVTGTSSFWVLQAAVVNAAVNVRSSTNYAGAQPTTGSLTVVAGDLALAFVAYTASTAGTEGAAMASPWANIGINNFSTTQSDTWRIASVASSGTQSSVVTTAASVSNYGVIALSVYVPTSNTPPTITGPGSINTTASTTNLTFAANDPDGTIASFALVNQSNTANTTITPTIGAGVVTGAGTANASVTFPVSGLTANAKFFFGATTTDNNGNVSTTSVATVNVTKDIPDIRSVVATGFTIVGGGTALDAIVAGNAQAAAGQTVTRYLESASPPGGATCIVTFQPITPSTVARAFAFPIKAKDTTTTETATVALKMNDNTTIATRGPITLTTTAAGCGGTTTLGTGSETAAITDYSKLSITVVTN